MAEDDADDAPLSDLARDVAARREESAARARGGTDADDPFAGSFTEMDVGDVDAETVWADLLGDEDEPVAVADPIDTGEDRDVRVIPKSTCHGCPHFGQPPELECTHEGTEIREMTSMDEFTVVDCPMVVDREDVEGVD